MLCEWYTPPCTPPPLGARKTTGTDQAPTLRQRIVAAWLTIWS